MRIRAVLKSLLFAYALTGVLLLLLAFALFSFDLGKLWLTWELQQYMCLRVLWEDLWQAGFCTEINISGE